MFSSFPLNKNQTLFNTPSTTAAVWTKPVDCKYVHIIMAGGGGGGGAGRVATGNRQGSGGGGGGSASHVSIVLPSILCPENLYMYIGAGGSGGAASGAAGTNGATTSIALYPENNLFNTLLLTNGGNAGGGGGTGTAGAAGTGVTVNGAPSSSRFMHFIFSARSDAAGAIGLSGDPGTAGGGDRQAGTANPIDTSGGKFILGGVGGGAIGDSGDAVFAGGSHTATAALWLRSTLSGGVAAARDGRQGIVANVPGFFVLGGTGGASTTGAAGQLAGRGGDGILGSGGGGGGAAYVGSTQGAGGRGGDGFVLITTF
jgi:hypothetical protein